MRLAILTSHPIQYHAPLFRELARRVDVHVFFAHEATPQQQASAGFGTAFEWDINLTSGYAHSFLRNVSRCTGVDHFLGCDTPEIGRRLREGEFDVLLVLGWHLKSFIQGILGAKRLGLPVMVRGDSQLGSPRSSLKKAVKALAYPPFLRLFDAALYVGQRSRAYYEHYRYPANRLFFSPHCVDNAWFAERATVEARAALRNDMGIAQDEKVVLFAGKLVPFKRPLDVVEACTTLRNYGLETHLLVAGSGELAPTLRARAASSDLPLHLLGFRNQTEMPAAYAAADVLVLPSSSSETWGLVANEALACERPIVVSDACGCAPDLAGDGRVGGTFAMGDVDGLARALAQVLKSPPRACAIAAKSKAYSLSAAADGLSEAIAYLSGEGGSRWLMTAS